MLIIKKTEFIEDSDSDFASDEKKKTRRSTSGFIFLLGDSPISWKSQQKKKKKKKKKKIY